MTSTGVLTIMKNTEIERIIDQVDRLHSGKNWVGTNFDELLSSVTEDNANLEIPNFNNTIHQICRHLVSDFLVLKRLEGTDYELGLNESWPQQSQISLSFKTTRKEIYEIKTKLIAELEILSDDQLDQPILPGCRSYYENLHGYIQHSYYHLGQISLINKFIENS